MGYIFSIKPQDKFRIQFFYDVIDLLLNFFEYGNHKRRSCCIKSRLMLGYFHTALFKLTL